MPVPAAPLRPRIGVVRLTGPRLCAAAALLAAAIGSWQLSNPHVLRGELGYNLGYDDGVYFGAALRFVGGSLPYRDFVLVHPPGIVYLLAPIALLARFVGQPDALAVARCLTVAATIANVALAGYLVRSRGRVAMATAAFVMATWPLTVAADRTVELEPWLALFCLIGACLLVDARGSFVGGGRMICAGAAFGVALSVKAWAILPIAACVLCLVTQWRGLGRYSIGVGAAVALICGPFFAFAPTQFWHDVVVDQLSRRDVGAVTSLAERLRLLSGVAGSPTFGTSTVLAVALLALLAVAVGVCFARRPRAQLEWFLLTAWVVTVGGMFRSAGFFDHYAYFPAAFLAPLIGVVAAALAKEANELRVHDGVRHAAAAVAMLAVILVGVEQVRHASEYLGPASDPGTALHAIVPAHSCVIADFPTDLVLADRYPGSDRACPAVVDPFGLYLALDNGTSPHLPPPGYRPAFQQQWQDWLSSADYLDLRIPFSDFVPWSPAMTRWFDDNYRLVAHLHDRYERPYVDVAKDEYVYERIR